MVFNLENGVQDACDASNLQHHECLALADYATMWQMFLDNLPRKASILLPKPGLGPRTLSTVFTEFELSRIPPVKSGPASVHVGARSILPFSILSLRYGFGRLGFGYPLRQHQLLLRARPFDALQLALEAGASIAPVHVHVVGHLAPGAGAGHSNTHILSESLPVKCPAPICHIC